jgi:hypothetical protein
MISGTVKLYFVCNIFLVDSSVLITVSGRLIIQEMAEGGRTTVSQSRAERRHDWSFFEHLREFQLNGSNIYL